MSTCENPIFRHWLEKPCGTASFRGCISSLILQMAERRKFDALWDVANCIQLMSVRDFDGVNKYLQSRGFEDFAHFTGYFVKIQPIIAGAIEKHSVKRCSASGETSCMEKE